jgi:hypothetical protein
VKGGAILASFEYLYELTRNHMEQYVEFRPLLVEFFEMAQHHDEEGFCRKFRELVAYSQACKQKEVVYN